MNGSVVDDNLVRVGAVYIWTDVALVSGRPVFVRSTNPYIKYPIPMITTGKYLGYTQNGCRQTFNTTKKETPSQGALSFQDARIIKDDFTVATNLVFNNDPGILSYLLPPGGRSSVGGTGGGANTQPLYNLVVLLNNIFPDDNRFLFFVYYKGYFDNTTLESSDKAFSGIEMTYKSGALGCEAVAGNKNYAWFYLDKVTLEITDGVPLPDGQSYADDPILSGSYTNLMQSLFY